MTATSPTSKSSLRLKADQVKPFVCKNLIVVLEEPNDWKNIGTVIRNVNALGAEKVYVIDPAGKLPEDWKEMRDHKTLFKISASAIRWTFVKCFSSTADCLHHLGRDGFISVATSPHIKGKAHASLEVADFTADTKLAIWFGNEIRGISEEALGSCSTCVSIPMHGIIESLNLATSTGIVLYEATRQRRAFQLKQLDKVKAKRASRAPAEQERGA